jgi:type VI secretion system protein ImpA
VQVADLLQEISPDAVCGPDLEYDPDFMALDQAARGKPEQQFGDTVVPAVEPNWRDVSTRAEALFARTKDLRVTVLLIRALLKQSEFVGLSDGLSLLEQLLSRFWDSVYPRLDEDDSDPTMRLNALVALTDADGFLRDLRAAQVIPAGSYGRVTVREILVAGGKLPAGSEGALSTSQIEGTIRAAAVERADSIAAARQSLVSIRALQALLNDKLGVERALDLAPVVDILGVVVKTCDSALGEESANPDAGGALMADGQSHTSVAAVVGEIRSREDSIRMLDRVCEFIERTEPSNPAPLLIRRAQRLISKNFIEIMEDLAPDSLGVIKGIAGL